MKKLLALLLSGVLCASVVYTAIATDEDPEDDNVVVITEEQETPSVSLDDLSAALGDDEQAKEIADQIEEAIKSGATQADVNALLMDLTDYINGKGYDVADLKNKDKAIKFVGKFLEDCGVDSEALGEALKGLDEISDNVFGDGGSGSSNGGTTVDDGYSYPDLDLNYGVESTTIPDTGIVD